MDILVIGLLVSVKSILNNKCLLNLPTQDDTSRYLMLFSPACVDKAELLSWRGHQSVVRYLPQVQQKLLSQWIMAKVAYAPNFRTIFFSKCSFFKYWYCFYFPSICHWDPNGSKNIKTHFHISLLSQISSVKFLDSETL